MFFLFTVGQSAYAQLVVPGYPVPLSQFSNQVAFQNPSAALSVNTWEVSISSRRNTGFWRNNQTYFLTAATRIQGSRSKNFHGLGLLAYYDKEGIYLKRYRGYFLYSYHVKLTKKLRLSGGILLGMMTYKVGNEDYEGGTGNGVDGNLGFMLTGNNFYVGATLAQLPQSRVQPINEITELKMYYQIQAGRKFELDDNFDLKADFNSRFYKSGKPDLFFQGGTVWKQTLGIYGIYRWQKQATLMVGLEKIKLDSFEIKAYFSYDVPVNGDVRHQALEFSILCVKPAEKNK